MSAIATSATQPRLLSASGAGDGFQWSFKIRATAVAAVVVRTDTTASVSITKRSVKMARLEAVLLVSDAALPARKLAQLATLADPAEVKELVRQLNAAYDCVASAFRIEQVANGFRLMTRPQFAQWLDKLHNRQAETKLSPPMLETLAIVAYRQPITRAEIERIRGVQTAEMLKQLMERALVKIGGEDDSLGRPFLYVTTRRFLELYGLPDLEALPNAQKLRKPRDMQLKLPLADADEALEEAA